MDKIKIRGKTIEYTHFLFDGCHKFYLTNETSLTPKMKEYGYDEKDLHPISELPDLFYESCSLRFISVFDTYEQIIPQCAGVATFRNINGKNYHFKFTNKAYLDGTGYKVW